MLGGGGGRGAMHSTLLGILRCILAWYLTASTIFAKILGGGGGGRGNPRAPPPLYETLKSTQSI